MPLLLILFLASTALAGIGTTQEHTTLEVPVSPRSEALPQSPQPSPTPSAVPQTSTDHSYQSYSSKPLALSKKQKKVVKLLNKVSKKRRSSLPWWAWLLIFVGLAILGAVGLTLVQGLALTGENILGNLFYSFVIGLILGFALLAIIGLFRGSAYM